MHCQEANFIISYSCGSRAIFANSTIYIHIGLNGEDNSKFSTSLIINRDRGRKRFIKFNLKSGDSNPNRKWTRSNTTPTKRLSIMKRISKESSLKDIKKQPTIYRCKSTLLKSPNNNRRLIQSIPFKVPSLLRGGNIHWSLWCYVVQRKKDC